MNANLHLGMYRRYLWEDRGLLIVLGEFSEVLESKKIYEARHRIAPAHGEAEKIFEKIMAAAALSAISLAERESWGWTLTLPGIAAGFFCGMEPEGMICGRIRPAQPGDGLVYLQRQKADGPLVQSHYETDSDDPVAAIQGYFDQVEQIQTRIALGSDGKGALVQSLPGGRFESISRLGNEALLTRCGEMADHSELKPMGEVVVFYECRCNEKMILDFIASTSITSKKEIFGGESSLDIECPRCGREYSLKNEHNSK